MPSQTAREATPSAPPLTDTTNGTNSDWRACLPTLGGDVIALRALRTADAGALLMALTTADVARFISRPPSTVEGFERFIAWSDRQRAAGEYACFAVVPRGSEAPVGLFRVRSLGPGFDNAEWGFALASPYWGTGVFTEGARMIVDFAFDVLGVYRLEARAAMPNGRANGALRKLGAVQEGVLRRSFQRDGEYHDQALWTILRDDWREAKAGWGPRVILH
ncbi:MAG TPA: GNAT family protein [Vicinamibacterales bacterium]|nr:GNAT family protein [Vicinamibacterales bacterium]